MNILQHYLVKFVSEPAPGYAYNILVSQPCKIRKNCCIDIVSKNVHVKSRLLKSTAAVDVVKDSTETSLCKNVPMYVCSTVGQQL